MKIEKPIITKFKLCEIKSGAVFHYRGEYYIKTDFLRSSESGIVNLETGKFDWIIPITEVELVIAKVVIE